MPDLEARSGAPGRAGSLLVSHRVSTPLTRRLHHLPAARYIHPKALATPAEAGEHDHNLDVADESSPNYLRWIADLIEPHLGRRVLELGAGIGSITQLYSGGHDVVAIDLSDQCVATLRQRFAGSPNVSVRQQDLRKLEAAGEQFDSVLMVNVLEHIQDDAGLLSTLPPVLKPAGTIVIYVPALNALYGQWDRKVGHFRRYSKWRMREIAREAGLEVLELRYVNALAIPAWVAFSRTDVDRTQSASLSIWDRTGVPVSRALEQRLPVPIGLNVLAVLAVPR
jgi:2-polyprenyl-3-methyl-5-hydroxy-6-metoxy-1,4-benzoquinol methylase